MKKRILSYSIVLCMLISLLTCDWCRETVYASNTANEIVSIAQREIGNGYSKYTQYTGPIGGRYDYAWCASFVSWCGNQAGVSCIGKTASCYSQYNYMISHGGQRVSSPQAGDIVFFYCNNCSGTANQWCHIGIMVDSSTSIDGNYNNKVSYDRSYSHYGSLGYKHSNGISKIYVRPNYGQATALLPGTVDSSWNVPTSVSASHRITTYDQWGNAESNHYIDPGDSCYIAEVYTNGFVKVQYPVAGGKRWAYAKASDFSISKKSQNDNVSFGSPVNLGTNFYAYIINTYAWKHLTNDGRNVSMRTETGAASQIWKFERQNDGAYKIINMQDNRVLDDSDFGQTNGTNVAVCDSNDSTAQRWFIYGTSGAYYLRAKSGNLVIDIKDASKADGANVQMWTKNDTVAQKFQIWKLNQPGKTNVRCTVGSGYTITTFSWDAVSNAKTYDLKIWKNKLWQGDAYKIIWDIKGTFAQVCLPPGYYEAYIDARNGSLINMSNNVVKFTVSNGSPVNLGTDYYANIVTNKNQLAFTNTNGNVDVRKLENSAKQIWHFKRQGDGTYTIQNCTDGKYFDTDNSRDANGTNIKVWPYNGSDAQKYYIFGSKQGEYILKPKCATRMVDVCGGNNNPGDNVQLWDFNGGDAQRLYINKTSKPAPAECKHQYGNWTTVKKATCTSNGTEQRKCNLCGKTETRTIKATGHKYTNKTIAPTATTKGYTLHTCSVCGYSYKDNYTDAKKQLQAITILAKPSKTTYNINDKIDTSGLKVVATYTDGSKAEVKGWKIDGSTAKAGTVSVRVCYTESGITKVATYAIQVKEAPKETVYVTYKTNGGSMSQTKQSGTKGSTIQLLNERPAKSVNVTFQPNGGDQTPSPISLSQTFKCWLYNSSTTMSTPYYPGSSLILTQNCTLYAQYNDAKLTTLPVISREGYVFDGWYTPNNMLAYEGMAITSDTVLIARWTEASVDEDDDKNDALAVGDELETDQAIYTITKTNGEYCVEYSELFDDDVTVTYIPDTVAIDGVVYKVTSVGEKAFYKNTALKKIVIGSCVEKISSKAFYGCTSLNSIVINSTKISNGKVGANAFKKVSKNVKVYVPASKYKAYKKLLKKAGVGSKAKIYKMRTR